MANTENRTSRMSLVLKPSTYRGVVALAQIAGKSANDLVVGILDALVTENAEMLATYQEATRQARKNFRNINPAQLLLPGFDEQKK